MVLKQIDSTWRYLGMDPLLAGCLAVALLLHILLIFWLTFAVPDGDRAQMQDVTVAVQLSTESPKKADYLAQANQQGGGQLREARRQTTPAPTPRTQDGQDAQQALASQPRPQPEVTQQAQQILVTRLSWKEEQQRKRKAQQKPTPTPQPSTLDQLMQEQSAQIDALEAQYAQMKQQYARISSIQTVDTVTTQASDSASYLERFRRQVERAGNRDLLALQQGIHGDVRLMVILLPDGSIRAIRLLASSGSAALDEAAKNSVRRAAPFPRFDEKMRSLSELRIIRTWRFSDRQDQVDVRGR